MARKPKKDKKIIDKYNKAEKAGKKITAKKPNGMNSFGRLARTSLRMKKQKRKK